MHSGRQPGSFRRIEEAGPLYPSGTLRIDELTTEERAVYATLKPESLPAHVAIIMDGNGRWAGHRSLKRFLGHQQGAKSVQLVTETASRIGLPWLTLYAFSLENSLRRPKAEVSFLMRLLRTYLENNVQRMNDNNVRIRYIGRTHELPSDVQDKMQWAAEATARNTGTTLTLALNYGSRTEIVDGYPRVIPDTEELVPVDAVVRAIGQSKLAPLYDGFGVKHERGIALVDTELRTSNPRVYAAGDCLFGGGAVDAMVVSAAQAGKDVAASVDRALRVSV